MSRNTFQKDTSSLGEDTPPTEQVDTTIDDIAIGTPKQPRKKRTEAEKLQTDTLAALNLDTNILHSGSRLLRSQKTLLDTEDEENIRKQFEHDRLTDQEIAYRPLRAGQTTQEKYLPTRQDFEYIYKHIEDSDCQTWASDLEPWLHFVKRHNLHADPSIPVLDKDGSEYPDAIFSLDTLLQLHTNKKYLKKKRKPYVSTHKTGLSSEDKDLPDHNSGDSGASSGSSSSFVVISSQTTRKLITPDPSLLDDPPSLGATPTTTPITTPRPSPTPPPSPTPTPSPNPSPTPSDPDMATLKERSVFFPSEKYDGRNKNLTKQHWQTFEDFCDQQKLYITDRGVDKPAATIEQISPFFKMTLTDLARAWMERQNFTSANELKEKFLTDFSPYGKTHRQWIARWAELKFNPDLDNIDEFLEKFEDLARLNNLGDDYKLHAFKIAMPKEIELHLRGVDNLQQCYQTAKDLLTIVQNPVTNKMSTLSLAQSRSPSLEPDHHLLEATEEMKGKIDKEMNKLCILGILRKELSGFSSPAMAIPRKNSDIPRVVADFRYLNTRLPQLNMSFPLVRECIQSIGASQCEVMSVIDLRDAYHTLRLSSNSQQYCGITPYYGSDTYLYQRLPMGLKVSPAIWQAFINKVLGPIPNRQRHIAIMDDCLVHSKFADHMQDLTNLFQSLLDHGLKISPKKCQFFRTSLIYMGFKFLIDKGRPSFTPMKDKCDSIRNLEPPKTVKDCRKFCGMVNFLATFLRDLQKHLVPIYNLTKKNTTFQWTSECQKSFDTIKNMLTQPPILRMPDTKGIFRLMSDTSILATGAALYQFQDNNFYIVGYNSKKLPEAAKNYSITELELFGLVINIYAFRQLLSHVYFECFCDHSAITYILSSKKKIATRRIQKLIEQLLQFNFSIHYLPGSKMHIADMLSRLAGKDLNLPDKVIPISFNAIQSPQPRRS